MCSTHYNHDDYYIYENELVSILSLLFYRLMILCGSFTSRNQTGTFTDTRLCMYNAFDVCNTWQHLNDTITNHHTVNLCKINDTALSDSMSCPSHSDENDHFFEYTKIYTPIIFFFWTIEKKSRCRWLSMANFHMKLSI